MITKYLIVFLISMVPLIELRGAIPYAVAFHIPTLPAYLIAVIGNMLPGPVIFLFARKVLVWGCDKKYHMRLEQQFLTRQLTGEEAASNWEVSHPEQYQQLSLFDAAVPGHI